MLHKTTPVIGKVARSKLFAKISLYIKENPSRSTYYSFTNKKAFFTTNKFFSISITYKASMNDYWLQIALWLCPFYTG